MSLDDALRLLHASASADILRFDGAAPPARQVRPTPCLDPGAIHDSCRWCGFDPPDESELLAAAQRIETTPELRLLIGHCYDLLYERSDYPAASIARWPDLQHALPDAAGLFYLLLALGAVPQIAAAHRRWNLPEGITRETCRGIKARAELYRANHAGRPGTYAFGLHWLRHYITGVVYRLGRFEYVRQKFAGGVEVYAQRATGRTLALAPDGAWFTADGYRHPGGSAEQGAGGWQASLRVESDAVAGLPISPWGMAERRAVRLPLNEWERVFGRDDWTLDMHIPAGGGMQLQLCAKSLLMADAFFRDRFPETPIRAISSNSWIFNNQLAEILPPAANLALFQRELYLFPVPSTGDDGFWFIFQRHAVRPGMTPPRTSLQRAVLDFLASGRRWRGGGMFVLTAHLPEFGRQVYRAGWELAAGGGRGNSHKTELNHHSVESGKMS